MSHGKYARRIRRFERHDEQARDPAGHRDADQHQRRQPPSLLPVYSPLPPTSQLPTPVPTTVAITVVSPIRPLADEILFGRSISGMLPSLAGPNSAA